MKFTATDRKAGNVYKPVIKIDGRTEVVQQSPERVARHTRHGVIPGNRYAQGTVYATRKEAVAAAQEVIDLRKQQVLANLARDKALGRSTDYLEKQLACYE